MITNSIKTEIKNEIKNAFASILPEDMPVEAKEQIIEKYNSLSGDLMTTIVDAILSANAKTKITRNNILNLIKEGSGSAINEKVYFEVMGTNGAPTGAKISITKNQLLNILSKGESSSIDIAGGLE